MYPGPGNQCRGGECQATGEWESECNNSNQIMCVGINGNTTTVNVAEWDRIHKVVNRGMVGYLGM